ncbi:protein CLT1, chloroplastic [Arachis ipaensis]|uniref:protein CLT1, chloroplastic n=1 Tax=Arachis ipaensis TaxID=130454 RepID=UPI000A2B2A57|nr:protein CLT1, chloroplastic [Arachis ipaensis]
MTSLCLKILPGGATSSAGDVRFWQRRRLSAICGVPYVHSSPGRPGIVLRQPRQWRRWEAEKAIQSGASECSRVESSDGEKAGPMSLVPLKQYPFFLAQLATFGYVLVYFSILTIRYRVGIVTDEMLSMPKTPFLVVGLLEALGAATGMAAGAMLSGASIPILSQTFLVWQILLSMIFLGRRYKVNQLLGCFLVATGVVITVASGSGAGNSLKEAGIFWSLLMIVSFLFQAADTVLKEVIFLDATRKLKGRSVDLFVVNSFGSAFQALFICLLLPFLSKLWGVPFSQLPNYLKEGAACFLNVGSLSSGCNGAPLLPVLFIIVNMGFNISLLYLLKISSAVVSCLASTFSVPISIYVFTLPLPYLGVASSLPTGFLAGAVILITGLLVYAWTPSTGSSSASLTAST